ncbi:MAG: hypothetical protein HY063_05910 [Bacteroidetes bacterium]|nr:hypothetical protein [Bacteroidota bacterium]
MNKKQITNKKSKLFTLEAELPVSLEELAIYIIREKEQVSDIVRILDKETERANKEIQDVMGEVIKEKKWDVKLKSVRYEYMDSGNLTHGVAYFKVQLQGKKEVLERISKDELFSEEGSPKITADAD